MRHLIPRLVTVTLLAVLIGACARSAVDGSSTSLPSTSTSASTTTSSIRGTATTESTTTIAQFEGTLIELTVSEGEVVGGGRLPVDLGSMVRLVVTADVADQVHLHGYDLSVPVTPAEPGAIEFVADIPGVFEIEMEESGLKLADLEVSP